MVFIKNVELTPRSLTPPPQAKEENSQFLNHCFLAWSSYFFVVFWDGSTLEITPETSYYPSYFLCD